MSKKKSTKLKKGVLACMHFAKRMAIAAVVVFALIFLRLAYAPTSVGFLADAISEPFKNAFPEQALSYDGVYLAWNMDETAFEFSLENVKIENRDGTDFASFPRIAVDFDGFNLLVGSFVPERIDFYGTDLNLAWSAAALQERVDKLLAREDEPEIELPEKPPVLEFMETLLKGEKENSALRSLKVVNIRDATLTLTETGSGVVWQIPDANLELVRTDFGLALNATLNFFSQGEAVSLGVSSAADEAGNTRIELEMDGLNPAALSKEVGLGGIFTAINMPLYGNIYLVQNRLNSVQSLEFDFGGGPGTVFYEPFQSSPAAFEDLELKAIMDPLEGLVEITEIRVRVDNATINGSGFLEYIPDAPKPGIRMSFTADNLGIRTLMKLWPPVPVSGGRKWINENIPKGTLNNLTVEVAFGPDTFETRPLPNEAMHLSVDFTGAEIHFLRPVPPITEADGFLTLQGNALQATITSGKIDDMDLAGIDFAIENMTVKKQQVGHATVRINAPINQIMTLLDYEPLQVFAKRELDPNDYFGDAETVSWLHVPLIKGTDADDIDYTIEATITGAAVPSLLSGGGLSQGTIGLTVTPSGLVATGDALLKGAPFDFYWTQDFEQTQGFSTRIELNGSLADEELHRFGLPEDVLMDGTARVYMSLRGNDGDLQEGQGTVDFFNAKVEARKMDWRKDANRPAEGSFELQWTDTELLVKNARLNSREMRLDAAFIFDIESGKMKRADVPLFISGGHDITATARQTSDGVLDVTVQARTLNAAPFIETMFGDSLEESFAPDMKLTLLATEATALNGVFFKNLSVEAEKRQEYWVDANLLGAIDDGGIFQVAIASHENGRTLRIESDNAGRAALGTNVFRNAVGGRLVIEAEMNVFEDPLVAAGTLTVTDLKMVKSSVLIQALAEDERSGLDDMIKERGVDFSDISIPFALANGVFDISDASAAGPSLGFTMEGQVTQDFERMNLNGTVVPAYTLNTIISRIPIIGTILMGGKGEGLIALNYRIEGTRADPNVTFNPASALTPGILRKLIGNEKGKLAPEEEAVVEPEVSKDPASEAEIVTGIAETPLPDATEESGDGEGDAEALISYFKDFLLAIEKKDYQKLAQYLDDENYDYFFEDGKLNPGIEDFVFGGPFIKSKGSLSIMDFLNLGDLEFKVFPFEDRDGFAIYVIPKVFLADASTSEFYNEFWMEKYFVCDFFLIDGQYKMSQNFCFAESGGPHQPEYG